MQKNTLKKQVGLAAGMFAAVLTFLPASASGDPWNERTIMKFSEAVMIPGATLQPGTYVFKLLDPDTNQHLLQITNEDESRVIATTQAVPVKRKESTGDILVKFNPTVAGGPPAIKAWFYPGSLYGHQFVYPDHQARQIAERTKSVVLSAEQKGSDMQKGVLHTYDATGTRGEWRSDPNVSREWQDWQKQRGSARTYADTRPGSEPDASATMVTTDRQGDRVALSELEEAPKSFAGKTISVDAEVQDVFGPRLFSIDEPNWGDLDGEILVHMPSVLAALVREGDRVTITGQVKPFVRAELEREWGWFDQDRKLELQLSRKPVLVATRIVGGNSNVAMVINANPAQRTDSSGGMPAAVGTSGTTAGKLNDGRVNDVALLNQRGDDLVGHQVQFSGVNVAGTAKDGGFWVRGPQGSHVFVLPTDKQQGTAVTGSAVDIKGVVLQMPRGMRDGLKAPGDMNDDVYVFATEVKKQS